MLRAVLAALSLCFVAISMPAEAHTRPVTTGDLMIMPGLQHMLASMDKKKPVRVRHRLASRRSGHRYAVHRVRQLAQAPQCFLFFCQQPPVPTGRSVAADVSSDIYQAVSFAAMAAGVPLNIAHAVVRMESGYHVNARSSAGAIGIMQVLPRTAAAMGENPYTVDGNLRAGMKYLALALRTSPDLCAAISGYNHGIAGRPYCTGYGRRVEAMAR
jgi:soluble lytic murein transglycosylase-like protein